MSLPRQILFHVTDRIANDAYVATPGIKVVSQLALNPATGGFLVQDIMLALGPLQGSEGETQMGLSVYTLLPNLRNNTPDTPGPQFEGGAELLVMVFENQEFNASASGFAPNGVGIFCDDLAMHIAGLFSPWYDSGAGLGVNLWAEYVNPLSWGPLPEDIRRKLAQMPDLVKMGVLLKGNANNQPLAKCAPVIIGASGGNTTLACASPASTTIYYSTDRQTLPTPAAAALATPTATEYAGPFTTPIAGTLLMAVAYDNANVAIASDVAAKQF